MLELLLEPPNRFFASWTRPDGDRRPAVLVAVFTAGLLGLASRWLLDRALGLDHPPERPAD